MLIAMPTGDALAAAEAERLTKAVNDAEAAGSVYDWIMGIRRWVHFYGGQTPARLEVDRGFYDKLLRNYGTREFYPGPDCGLVGDQLMIRKIPIMPTSN